MIKYALNILFDNTDLPIIYKAKQKIVISKQNQAGSKLTWAALTPFQYNTVEWTDDYAVYCSNAEITTGVKIRRLSDIDAHPGVQYIFKDGYFSSSPNNSQFFSNQTYHVQNEMQGFDSLLFGLAQGIVVNGRMTDNHPINAVPVPYMQCVSFSPHEVIEVYLASAHEESIVVDNTYIKPLTIAFGADTGAVNIKYNSAKGTFIMR